MYFFHHCKTHGAFCFLFFPQGPNKSNFLYTVMVNCKLTIDTFSTCLTFSMMMCLISAAQQKQPAFLPANILEMHHEMWILYKHTNKQNKIRVILPETKQTPQRMCHMPFGGHFQSKWDIFCTIEASGSVSALLCCIQSSELLKDALAACDT